MTAALADGGGLVHPHCARRDSGESGCQPEGDPEAEEGQPRQLTPFEKLTQDMCQDEKVLREITLGKRVGFYRIRGDLGSGNFSQVKLGIHSLTKGRISVASPTPPPPRGDGTRFGGRRRRRLGAQGAAAPSPEFAPSTALPGTVHRDLASSACCFPGNGKEVSVVAALQTRVRCLDSSTSPTAHSWPVHPPASPRGGTGCSLTLVTASSALICQ